MLTSSEITFIITGYKAIQKLGSTRIVENLADHSDEEIEIEIIEVEEPEEPVPMQDSCLQVTLQYYSYF